MLRHAFTDAALLEQALTHRSASPGRSNERLEFLGDAVINLLAAELLYARWPRADEGVLSRGRSELVRESALAGIARGLGLGNALRLGPGEIRSGGFRRDSTLADALEAVLGAIYLDGGLYAARQEAEGWLLPLIKALPAPGALEKDAKTRLQEWVQARGLALPGYALVAEEGPEHARTFTVTCTLESHGQRFEAQAQGGSRRGAEQLAAAQVLGQLAP